MWSELLPAPMASTRDGGGLDEATLEKLFVKLEKPMFNVVYRWLWNAGDAEEVVQEAFLRVWKGRAGVDVATVEPLLYRTALNLASNRRRSARLWRWLGLDDAGEEPADAGTSEEALSRARQRARVRAAIDALPERLREVVMLTEYAELSYGEIAATLGIPAGTVGSRRNAALARLAEALGPIEDA
jgi:RNA polymerase sigma-70 factor (ECF subfamily)